MKIKDKILSETSEEVKQRVRDTANKLVMKQETLEEAVERLYPENIESIMDGYHDSNSYQRESFINGYKLAQERSYSEEEVKNIVDKTIEKFYKHFYTLTKVEMKEQWFEQFKKK